MKYFRHRAHRFYQSADRQYQVTKTSSDDVIRFVAPFCVVLHGAQRGVVSTRKKRSQEALRIDPARADLLAGYAAYLLTMPERAKEADKYYTLALQANPHNDELKAKHERFHNDLTQRHQPHPIGSTESAASTPPLLLLSTDNWPFLILLFYFLFSDWCRRDSEERCAVGRQDPAAATTTVELSGAARVFCLMLVATSC